MRQWWQIKKILYANLYSEKRRTLSGVFFSSRIPTKQPATQSSITWQKCIIFERNFYVALRGAASIVQVDRAFDIYKSGPFVSWHFFRLTCRSHATNSHTHLYFAISFRLSWHTLIHSFFTSLEDTRTHRALYNEILKSICIRLLSHFSFRLSFELNWIERNGMENTTTTIKRK